MSIDNLALILWNKLSKINFKSLIFARISFNQKPLEKIMLVFQLHKSRSSFILNKFIGKDVANHFKINKKKHWKGYELIDASINQSVVHEKSVYFSLLSIKWENSSEFCHLGRERWFWNFWTLKKYHANSTFFIFYTLSMS